jgi:hypothetical protein
MVRRTPASLHDKQQSLIAAREETEAEVSRLEREERFLQEQLKEAREQVRYYESLLASLRSEWGRDPPLARLVRKLG